MTQDADENAWHAIEPGEVASMLDVRPAAGLAEEEARRRLEKFGRNEMRQKAGRPAWKRFLLQFHQPLIYILLGATLATALFQEWVDASVIFAVVFLNACIGYLQESRAEKAIDALSRMVLTEATVLRDGEKRRIPSSELVPGDVVLLQSGDRVPADLRLIQERNLRVDESALTGESAPAEKQAETLDGDAILADRANMAFTGTLVTFGQGKGIVTATGNATETGQIAQLMAGAEDLQTPLTRKIAQFSKLLLGMVLLLGLVTFVLGIWRGGSAFEMFMAAVALAVAAVPEGLPAAVTITLAIGVARMARRQAIIRKLPAVETLGSTTVICSDKTGTLTQNQVTVQEIYAADVLYHVTGAGYEADGRIHHQDEPVAVGENVALVECLGAGLLCNDSRLVQVEGRTTVQGDPTEAALIVAAQKGGLSETEMSRRFPRIEVIPFESEYKYMATLHGPGEGTSKVIYLKGAVETLLEKCSHALTAEGRAGELDREAVLRKAEEMAAKGLRVLAFARREMPAAHDSLNHEHVSGDLTFLGLQGKMDPPRPEVIAAVRLCRKAGIHVKMITGDHVLTAQAIASQIGLETSGNSRPIAVTGRDLERLPDEELRDIAEKAAVFARVAPEQKLRLVTALQARGNIVAMTGDGVNDAPALRQADIGVAMGRSGTDVAKEAADMLLTDDNFATIEAAVEEGRGIFDNLTKFIIWTIPTNAGQALIIIAAIVAGLALPLLPVQLLWVNLTTAIFLGLTLVFEPKEAGLMERPPRDPRMPILTFPLFMRTGLVTLIMMAGAFALFLWKLHDPETGLDEVRTTVVNVVIVVQAFYLLNCRCLSRSMFQAGLFSNPLLLAGIATTLGAQLLFTYAPFMNKLFHTAPLPLETWGYIGLTGLVAYGLVELEKWIRFRQD